MSNKMPSRKARYTRLMEQILSAHRQHQVVWVQAWAEARGTAAPLTPKWYEAMRYAYRVAAPQAERRDEWFRQLFGEELGPLQPQFLAGAPEAVHAVIDFLEIDIPAFRCGYAKQWYLRKLKSIPLRDEHRDRLQRLALAMCSSPHRRRELTELGRLMIKLADPELVERLHALAKTSSGIVARKAERMLGQIVNSRRLTSTAPDR